MAEFDAKPSQMSSDYQKAWLANIPEKNKIQRVTREQFFSGFYNLKIPCIVTGLDWPCQRWTPEYLSRVFEDYTHTFKYGSESVGDEKSTLHIKLKEYIARLFVDQNDTTEAPSGLPVPSSTTEKVIMHHWLDDFMLFSHRIITLHNSSCMPDRYLMRATSVH
jgi:hypothetical protein